MTRIRPQDGRLRPVARRLGEVSLELRELGEGRMELFQPGDGRPGSLDIPLLGRGDREVIPSLPVGGIDGYRALELLASPVKLAELAQDDPEMGSRMEIVRATTGTLKSPSNTRPESEPAAS